MRVSRFRLLFLAIASIALTGSLFGQGISTGSITGVVQDKQGAVVTNAKATAVQEGTNVSTSANTNPAGEFQLRNLAVGVYQVTVEAPGFGALTITGIVVNAGVPTTIGTKVLGVAGSSSNVQVTDSSPLLQTDPMQTSATFETQAVQNLPIGNGFDSLALLVPGVASTGDANFSNNNGASFSTNGQRGRDNNFQIDGQNNNDTGIGGPVVFFGNQDAIQEVQVLTNYSAEYGRNTGAIINYITKQGSNEYHGSAFELYNGNWADSMANQDKSLLFGFCPGGVPAGTATPEATSGCTTPVVPRYVDNRFGGTIGGPILKDKLWFFGSTNLERQTGGNAAASSAGLVLPDPTGIAELQAAFPGNPAVAALTSIGPSSNKVGTLTYGAPQIYNVGMGAGPTVPIEFATLTRTIPSTFSDNEGEGRIDWQVTGSDRVFGRYIYQSQLSTNAQFDGGAAAAAGDFTNVPGTNQELGLDYTHTFSNSILNQVRYNYLSEKSAFNPAGFTGCIAGSIATCPTNIAFDEGTAAAIFDGIGVGAGFPQSRDVLDNQVQDNASWLRGRHSFKFGGEYNYQSNPNFFLPAVDGVEIFPAGGGATYSFDNFLANTGYLTLGLGNPSYTFHENQFAFYFQDDWRFRDNLTLSLGLRYELYGQAINSLHDETVARESNPATALWSATDTSGAASPLSARTVASEPINYKNFSPIIGFAYTPKFDWLGKDSTVIRGGFRIAYDPEFYNLFANIATAAPAINLIQFSPCATCLASSGLGTGVVTANGPYPQTDVGLATQELLSPNLHNPYTEQWSFGVQHEFGSKAVAEVRYIGNHALRQFQYFNANPALGPLIANGFSSVIPAGYTPCTDTTQAGYASGLEFANCKQTDVSEVGNTGFSEFDGLEARFDTREWHGATIGVSYTYSHTIDNTSEIYGTNAGGNTLNEAQNPFNIGSAERANSGIDYPNVASVYALYSPPIFQNQSTIKGKLLGGWQIAPLYRFTSGQPYTVEQDYVNATKTTPSSLCDPNGLYGGQIDACRPILSDPSAPFSSVGVCTNPALPNCGIAGPVHWIENNLAAAQYFGTPFAGASRNIYRGQPIDTINLSLLKDIKFRERYSLELRATAYNLFNHQFLGNPNPNINDTTSPAPGVPGPFGNNFYNSDGANQAGSVFNGIDRRRIEVGAKILF